MAKNVGFRGPNFFNNRKHTRKLCQQMIDEKLGIKWGCHAPIVIGNDEQTLKIIYHPS